MVDRVQHLSFIKGFEQGGNCIWLLGDCTASQVGASANEYGGKSTSTTFQTIADINGRRTRRHKTPSRMMAAPPIHTSTWFLLLRSMDVSLMFSTGSADQPNGPSKIEVGEMLT
jgi:hypothetical protein